MHGGVAGIGLTASLDLSSGCEMWVAPAPGPDPVLDRGARTGKFPGPFHGRWAVASGWGIVGSPPEEAGDRDGAAEGTARESRHAVGGIVPRSTHSAGPAYEKRKLVVKTQAAAKAEQPPQPKKPKKKAKAKAKKDPFAPVRADALLGKRFTHVKRAEWGIGTVVDGADNAIVLAWSDGTERRTARSYMDHLVEVPS